MLLKIAVSISAIWLAIYLMNDSDPRLEKVVKIIQRDIVTDRRSILWWLDGYEKYCDREPEDPECKRAEVKIKKIKKVVHVNQGES